jgi:hypothetical protein
MPARSDGAYRDLRARIDERELSQQQSDGPSKRDWRILAAVLVGASMAALETSLPAPAV